MKALTAQNDFGHDKRLIPLADIMVDDKSVVSVAPDWAIFARNLQIATSIAQDGLKNPVIVLADGEGYKFVASGARIQYAVINGYTHIDAIVVDNEAQVRPLMVEQAKTEEQYLQPQYIHRWWEGN